MPLATRPRVLLADDYAGMVTAIARLIGYDCELVGTLNEGTALLETVERVRPDVVLLDLNLPNVNSIDACRYIRGRSPSTRVIVLTGGVDSGIEDEVLAAGASAFIDKVAIVDKLLPAIRSVLVDARG